MIFVDPAIRHCSLRASSPHQAPPANPGCGIDTGNTLDAAHA
ncbi:hypothetical protein [Thiolapillus sp.]